MSVPNRAHNSSSWYPRYGYRMITALLRKQGWQVNRKRVYRLWVQEGLKVPKKQHKKHRLGSSDNSCVRRKAEYKNHIWTWDFVHDRTSDGRPLKWLSIADEYTRECIALEVGRSMTAEKVIAVLIGLFHLRGLPQHIRSDNGPEFIAKAIRRWLPRRWTCSTWSRARPGRTATWNRSTFAAGCAAGAEAQPERKQHSRIPETSTQPILS